MLYLINYILITFIALILFVGGCYFSEQYLKNEGEQNNDTI